MSVSRILLAEDEDSLALGLVDVLVAQGYEVVREARGDRALERLQEKRFDLVVLDIELPGLSGIELLKQLRRSGNSVRVLMLTARGGEIDRVVGFEHGADDYVVKPFSLAELLGRIKALLRRSLALESEKPGDTDDSLVKIGRVRVDFSKFQLWHQDQQVEGIPAKGFAVLRCLLEHQGQVVTRDQLIDSVWGEEEYITSRTLNNLIVKLRQAIEDNAEKPRCLLTVHGVGYRLESV